MKEFVVDGTKWEEKAKIDQTGYIEKYGTISLDKIYAKDENEIKKFHLLVDNILKVNGLYE